MSEELRARLCEKGDLDDIMALQDAVFCSIGENANILRRNTEETFLRCMSAGNITIGVFDGGILAGVAIMEDARGRDDDLGIRLKTPVPEEYADMKLVMLRREYYGRGLQRKLMTILEKLAYMSGYRVFCTSVAPDNSYSRDNMIRLGYEYDSSMALYGGLARDIFVKRLTMTEDEAEMLRDAASTEEALQILWDLYR